MDRIVIIILNCFAPTTFKTEPGVTYNVVHGLCLMVPQPTPTPVPVMPIPMPGPYWFIAIANMPWWWYPAVVVCVVALVILLAKLVKSVKK